MNYISLPREQLEAGALGELSPGNTRPNVSEQRIQASIAISLKRIADSLEKPTLTLTAGHGISLEESLSNSISNLANTLAEHRMYSK